MAKSAGKSILSIRGTRANIQSGQLLVSSGIPSLDEILGGGLPVGSIALLEEDSNGPYSRVIMKYFLAEGVVHKHSIFVGSQDYDPKQLAKELPTAISSDPEPEPPGGKHLDTMKIAFRYQKLPTSQKQVVHHFGNYYDLSKNMPEDRFENINVSTWSEEKFNADETPFLNPHYMDLLAAIRDKIEGEKFFVHSERDERNVLRIALHSLGSPMWFPKGKISEENNTRDLNLFFYYLRALLRSSFAVALVTVPSHLYSELYASRLYNLSDVVMALESFAGTSLESNPSLSDFHGYFRLRKLAPINTFASKHPGSVEYVFKLRLKKFCIEMLHLPPDLGDSGDDGGGGFPKMGCGVGRESELDF